MHDVIIVGGGPAGLSAALILGRCRRKVLVCDDGRYRNARSHGLHGYLTRDCIHPADFLEEARRQLAPYGIECRHVRVERACQAEGGFEVTFADGGVLPCRKLLVATGVEDIMPPIPGVDEYYGRSVFHCPYCDGWEMRDQPIAVYARGAKGANLAMALLTWSGDVALCSDGPAHLNRESKRLLAKYGIPVCESRIVGLEGEDGKLRAILFKDGERLPRTGLFFQTGQRQRSSLAESLGCTIDRKGAVKTNKLEGTSVAGLYVAGDASRDVQLVIVAAAEGAKAGFAINTALQKEDRPSL